jgi:hypothetical protein
MACLITQFQHFTCASEEAVRGGHLKPAAPSLAALRRRQIKANGSHASKKRNFD